MGKSGNSLVNGIAWSFMERIISQGVGTVISIILARLILPEEYGIIAAVTIFTSVATTFVTGGFGSALIQKKDAQDVDYSSMFIFNTVFSVFAYFIVYFSAPYLVKVLKDTYEHELLVKVLRFLGAGVIFSSFNSFFRSKLVKEFQFKKIFCATITGTLLSAVCGIAMAYMGYGVWALVGQQLVSYITNTICFVFLSGWRPKMEFSFSRLKPMLSFGGKLMLSTFITTLYTDIYSIAIATRYSSDMLAFYKKGNVFPKLLVVNIISSINTALFPVMVKMNTSQEYKSCVKKFNKLSTFIIAPMMFGFAAVATNFISLLLTDKWLSCVPFLQIACFNYALQPIGIANLQYWKASGQTTLYLVADIVKKIIGITFLGIVIYFDKSVTSFAVAELIATAIATIINLAPAKKHIKYSVFEQIKDVLPQFVLSGIMFGAVCGVGVILDYSKFVELVIQIFVGIIVYMGGAWLFKLQEMDECINYIKPLFSKRTKKNIV